MATHAPADGHSTDTGQEVHHVPDKGHAAPKEIHHIPPNAPVARNINELQFGTGKRLRHVVSKMKEHTSDMEYEETPPLPSTVDIAKAAALGSFIITPHAALTAYAGYKAYDLAAKYTPVAYVDPYIKKGTHALWQESKEILSKATNVATAPARVAGSLLNIPYTYAKNILRFGAKTFMNVIVTPAVDVITDLETAINQQYHLPEGTNLPAQILIGLKNGVTNTVQFPFKMLYKYPKTTIGTAIIGTGLLVNAGGDPLLASSQVVNAIGETIRWIGNMFAPK